MTQKKILFISPFFFPEQISSGKYNSYLVEKLLNSGYQVDVIALHPFYPEWIISETAEPFKSAKVYRYGENIKFPRSQVLRRILLEIQYAYLVFKHLFKQKIDYDFVIPVFPPVLFMLLSNRFFRKSLKLGIVHDVQGVMAKTEKSLVRKLSASIMGKVESLVYNQCDRLICLSRSMKDEVVNKFGIPMEKCEVFYPFVSIPDSAVEGGSSSLDDIFDQGFIQIVYSGALGEKQCPFELFNFFAALTKKRPDIKCHIFSRGPIFNDLVKKQERLLYDNIYCHDLVAESDLISLYNNCTVQIIPQAAGTGSGAFPSKLPNLLAHGVPVFVICDKDSELDRVVRKVEFAQSVNSWDNEIMMTHLLEFIQKVDGIKHNEILLENKRTILNEFDVENFIKSLST